MKHQVLPSYPSFPQLSYSPSYLYQDNESLWNDLMNIPFCLKCPIGTHIIWFFFPFHFLLPLDTNPLLLSVPLFSQQGRQTNQCMFRAYYLFLALTYPKIPGFKISHFPEIPGLVISCTTNLQSRLAPMLICNMETDGDS